MKPLDDYFKIQKEIYDYFGYEEDWVVIPLDDCREYYWILFEKENGSGFVRFHENKETILDQEGMNYYQHPIYTQRFLPKWVYRTEDYTMICVDTQTDGNRFLSVFDNSKEVKVPSDYEIKNWWDDLPELERRFYE